MDQILNNSDRVIGIKDDVVVHRKDDKKHEKHLHKFMRIPYEHGLVFNKDKWAIKQTSIVFFRCVYDTNGAHPDPEKVSAVQKMLAPEIATQLQKFLGLPSFFFFTASLHGLQKKGTEFIWNNSYKKAFDKVKSMVCKDTTMWYFVIHKPVTVQVDASQKDLAALLHDGCPVALLQRLLCLQNSAMPTQNMSC